jgi:predicted enzyme related to lactoylglutathione lyase
MPHPVVHFDIAGTDANRTQKFYTSLFDWQLDTSFGPDYGMVAGSEGGIGGGLMATMIGKPFVTVYVQVDDVSAYLEKATGLGGKAIAGPTDMPNGAKWALFEDPDGNTIGLYTG